MDGSEGLLGVNDPEIGQWRDHQLEETSPRAGSSRKTEHLLDIYSGKTLGTFRIILSLFWPLRALQLRLVKIVKKGKRT